MNSYYWFKHNKCASFDERMTALISREGAKGYGTYWYIIEKISMQSHQKISFHYLNSIKRKGFSATYMKRVITDYGLFNVEGDFFSSVILYSKPDGDDSATYTTGRSEPDDSSPKRSPNPGRQSNTSDKDCSNTCHREDILPYESSAVNKCPPENEQHACSTPGEETEATGNAPDIVKEPIEEEVECIKHYVYDTLRKGELYLNRRLPENEADRRTYYLFSMQKVLLELGKDLKVFKWFLRWNWVNNVQEMDEYLSKKRLKLNGYWPKSKQKVYNYSTSSERKPNEFSTENAPKTMPGGGFILTLINLENKLLKSNERIKHIYLYEIDARACVLRTEQIRIDKIRTDKLTTAEKEEEKERDSVVDADDENYKAGKAFVSQVPSPPPGSTTVTNQGCFPRKSRQRAP